MTLGSGTSGAPLRSDVGKHPQWHRVRSNTCRLPVSEPEKLPQRLREPRGWYACLDADRLEVLEAPNQPSADFFHTRGSPRAHPAPGPNRPDGPRVAVTGCPGRTCPRALPGRTAGLIDCSDAFTRRAASATSSRRPGSTARSGAFPPAEAQRSQNGTHRCLAAPTAKHSKEGAPNTVHAARDDHRHAAWMCRCLG